MKNTFKKTPIRKQIESALSEHSEKDAITIIENVMMEEMKYNIETLVRDQVQRNDKFWLCLISGVLILAMIFKAIY